MQPGPRAAFVLGIAVAATSAARASAHIDLLEPEPRAHGTAARDDTDIDVNSNLKNAPCGQIASERTERVTTYAPGQRITLRVREENAHVSYLRVRLDLDGADFPLRTEVPAPETQEDAMAAELALGAEGLLAVVREDNDTPGFVHELEVTLPNETCLNCTLQVAQFMYDDPAAPHYFQCADLVIADAPLAGDAGGAAEGGGAEGAGTNGTGANGSENADPANLDPGAPIDAEAGGSGSSTETPAGSAGEMSASSAAGDAPTPDGAPASGLRAPGGSVVASPGGNSEGGGCTLAPATRRMPSLACLALAALGVARARRRRYRAALTPGSGAMGYTRAERVEPNAKIAAAGAKPPARRQGLEETSHRACAIR
jgi:hypothetical protein